MSPAANRLLRNLLNYAARELDKPLTELPSVLTSNSKPLDMNERPKTDD
jgi:hypothetical protein